jgi:ATP-binding cassette, subfamily B, multidrug efflux pump
MIGFMGGRGGPGMRLFSEEGGHPQNRGRVFSRLVQLLRPYRKSVVLALILVVLSAASQGAGPFLIGFAVDKFIGTGNIAGLGQIMVVLIIVFAAGLLANRYQILVLNYIGQKLLADLRQSVFDKIESLSLQFLESSQAGELMSRLVNDIDALNTFFTQGLAQMVGMLFSLMGIVVAMLILNWKLALVVILMLPILFYTTRFFSNWARSAYRTTRETLGDVSSGMEEELGGVKVAQAFNRTDENIRQFATRNAANRDANVNANAVSSAFSPAMDVLGTVDTALVATIGGAMVLSGSLSIGVVVAFLQYVQNFFRPIQQIASLWALAQ